MSYRYAIRSDGASKAYTPDMPSSEGERLDGGVIGRRAGQLLIVAMLYLAGASLMSGCSLDGLLKSDELPPNVTDPKIAETPAGARMAYNGTLIKLQEVFGSTRGGNSGVTFVEMTGLLSDELVYTGQGRGLGPDPVDLRALAEGPNNTALTNNLFSQLNNLRQSARQAAGLVGDYLPQEPALRAHLYAVEAYTEVMLAELYCSGIPLSTVDYKGDYTLRPGSSTAEVFTHAAALFDTAIAQAGDSAPILNLSRVGQARALLGLGDYAAAAAAVGEVPVDFRYALHYVASDSLVYRGLGYYNTDSQMWYNDDLADREGTNGLDYRSSGDPRTLDSLLDNGHYHPMKYHIDGVDTVVLASGTEARLIKAEAALRAGGGDWLDTLNALRASVGLADTTDPGATLSGTAADSARINLLFRERAFWLYLTGHRQGDMRRLVRQYRQYGFAQEGVYPIGRGPYGAIYDTYVDAPIPWAERVTNPMFTGCRSRD